ncbi:MAG: transglycosylase SLT domain-containing protein [Gemmatimonadota bacterium]|nr:transglycosylase SLT domain-containing protein [Gemmatimonadota bacterium]MDE3005404.1 transglycosylase SLT domain-containing protein [Gemmatimonadota bacterium]MDE3012548.1 transglycosylase SLT domain-containing protein [Gemmatimonadota bacterium]
MTLRISLASLCVLLLAGAVFRAEPEPWTSERTVSDSALDELSAGRFWHAARVLRAEGAAEGTPADVLTLAQAEAGWENWPAVLDLLRNASWLRHEGDGEGYGLLGRSLEHAGEWGAAASTYLVYLEFVSEGSLEAIATRVRLTRTAWWAGDQGVAMDAIAYLRGAPHARSWIAAELALAAADSGDVAGVRRMIDHAVEPGAAGVLWRAEADALLTAGDSVEAAESFATLVRGESGNRRASAMVELGRLRVAAGDTTAGRQLLLEGFHAGASLTKTRAAETLTELGDHDFARTLELARILDRAGDGRRALIGYDRAVSLADAEAEVFPESSRLERARIMSTVAHRQAEALAEFREIRETTESERVGARNLEVWAQMRRRQGLSAQVNTLRRWLLDEYPSSAEAAEVAWSQGSNAEARGDLDRALDRYAFLAENVRTHARAGQARMRSGQIHLRRANLQAAAGVFEAYLADFPDGRRWQEAAYWAGRTRLQLGDTTVAQAHLNHVLTQPIEYYAVMAADLLEIPFTVNLPEGSSSIEPGWLMEGLARLDLLTSAGLHRGASAEITRLRERAGDERGPRLRLAEALIERGRTIEGINLGWALFRDEGAWDQRILRVTYPFPYRELVRREAEEWGVDPFMLAAIIRQESAFKADIVSHAGAIGLMQVMPPTGAELARAHGPAGFTQESLTRPEVNLHLGAAFFVDMSRRYDDELPLVLSAYNAGPTRATRWRRYPEASDPLRFTERIPFTETRGYVKSVRRNLGLYRALYGQD